MTFALPPKQQSPLDYTGPDLGQVPAVQFPRAPLPQDIHYPLFTLWRNSNPAPVAPDTTGDAWLLTKFDASTQPYTAVWIKLATAGGGNLETLTPDSGGVVNPVLDNINLHGVGNVTTTNGGAGQINLNLTGLTQHDVLVGGAANAITSVGPGTIGQLLASNGAGVDPSFQNAAGLGGSLVLIQSQTAAASTTLDFTTNTNLFRTYIFVFGITPNNNTDTMQLLLSNDGGATWEVAGYTSGITYHPYNSALTTTLTSTTFTYLTGPCSNSAANEVVGTLLVTHCNIANKTQAIGRIGYHDTTLAAFTSGSITMEGPGGTNAFRFQSSSGGGIRNNSVVTCYALKTS